MIKEFAKKIAHKLQDNGYIAYFAGGCVRDSILKLEANDYDIATNAAPNEIKKIFPKSQNIGAHFGVMLIREGGINFEVATFRKDGSYRDNRRPESVQFTNPKEDAFRRDFTINGLFQDPISRKIHDYVNGKKDLEKKIIRSIGVPENRFKEDALRLLRAIRFSTVLNFEIETNTWHAIKKNSHLLKNISVERITQEFNKIILHPNRQKGFDLLVKSNLIKYIIPEILKLKGCKQPPQFHPEGDVYVHTYIMLGLLRKNASLNLCIATMLHDIGKPDTYTYDEKNKRIRFNGHDKIGADISRIILNRLKYPKENITNIVSMVKNHMNFMNVSNMKKSTLRRFLARPTFHDDLELHRVDCLGSNGNLENYEFICKKELEFKNQPIIPKPLVTGNDLINMKFKPSAQFSQILKEVQNQQLEGILLSKQDAVEFITNNYI